MINILEKQKKELSQSKALLCDQLIALEEGYKEECQRLEENYKKKHERIKTAIKGINDACADICATIQSLGGTSSVTTETTPTETVNVPTSSSTITNVETVVTPNANYDFSLDDILPIVQNCCQYPYPMVSSNDLLKKQMLSMSDTVYDFVISSIAENYKADNESIKTYVNSLINRK